MIGKTEENHWLPTAKHYRTASEALERIEKKLTDDKEVSKDKKENYIRVIR